MKYRIRELNFEEGSQIEIGGEQHGWEFLEILERYPPTIFEQRYKIVILEGSE